jgi:hypothetical protein
MTLPHRRHRAERDEGDERHEQSVLEQVLAVFTAPEPAGFGEALECGDCNC